MGFIEQRHEDLFDLIKTNQMDKAQIILDSQVDLSQSHMGQTALCLACLERKKEMVFKLLAAGADPFQCNELSNSPLHCAVLGGSFDIIEKLVSLGADVNLINRHKMTPLHRSCMSPRPSPKVVELLLEAGASMNVFDAKGKTPLHYACGRLNAEIINLLLEKGVNLNTRTINNLKQTPLMIAATTLGFCFASNAFRMPLMELLCASGARITRQDMDTTKSILKVNSEKLRKYRLSGCSLPYTEVMSFLYDQLSIPKTLKDSARLSVRNYLQMNGTNVIREHIDNIAPYPNMLKDFLKFKNITSRFMKDKPLSYNEHVLLCWDYADGDL